MNEMTTLTDKQAIECRRAAYREARKYFDHDDAEDVAGECLLRLYKALETQDIAALKTYVVRTSINLRTDLFRKKGRLRFCSLDALYDPEDDAGHSGVSYADLLADLSPGPSEVLFKEEYRTQVRAAVSKLSTEHREAIHLYYGVGLEVENIGKLLGIPTGTVKSRLHRARAGVARTLAAYRKGLR